MKNRTTSPLSYLLACGLLLSQPASALHSVMLAVPTYSEEALTWCGAATGQMLMDGYPSGSCSILQQDVWMSIQNNKVESQWDTDPVGLAKAMNTLCPPIGSWSVRSRTDEEELMHSVAYWFTKNNYPAAGLMSTTTHNSYLAHSEHWVAIRGIITDLDPTTNPSVTLEHVWFNDPAVDLGDPALVRFVTGTTWYSEMFPVSKAGSTYIGKHVAIIEPPVFTGKAIAKMPVLIGKLITPDDAKKYATRWIKEYKLTEYESYKMLKEATSLEPMLVNAEHGGYYIIPYTNSPDKKLASAAIIVNAYTGDFEEVGSFAPISYLSKQQATSVAITQLGKNAKITKAELIYPLGERIVSRYFPIWKVTSNNRSYGITRQGEFLNKVPTQEFFVSPPSKRPVGLTFDTGRFWSLDREKKTLQSFDPYSGAPLSSYPLKLEEPRALAYSGNDVWIADQGTRKLVAIDPETGKQQSSFDLPIPEEKGFQSIEGMAWDGKYLWIAYFAGFSSSLNKIDPKNGELIQSIFADCHPKGIESDGTNLWTLCYNGKNKPTVIDQRPILELQHEILRSRKFIKSIDAIDPSGLAYDGNYLWYSDRQTNRVLRAFPMSTK
jgi:DNA-binding beta-propeller fold protein YncE